MEHRDAKRANAVGNMVLTALLNAELPQTFNYKATTTTKQHNICKSQYSEAQ